MENILPVGEGPYSLAFDSFRLGRLSLPSGPLRPPTRRVSVPTASLISRASRNPTCRILDLDGSRADKSNLREHRPSPSVRPPCRSVRRGSSDRDAEDEAQCSSSVCRASARARVPSLPVVMGVCSASRRRAAGPSATQHAHPHLRSRPADRHHLSARASTAPPASTRSPPSPSRRAQCAPVPGGRRRHATSPYHLYALVTQSAKGQLAAVDLTAGFVVDTNKATTGGSELPPRGRAPQRRGGHRRRAVGLRARGRAFKPAHLRHPGRLRSSATRRSMVRRGREPLRSLTSWPVCGLPQAPGPDDHPSTAATAPTSWRVVLPGDANNPGEAHHRRSRSRSRTGPSRPGSLAPCPITSTVILSGAGATTVAIPTTQAPVWSDGINWLDGGAPAEDDPPTDSVCSGWHRRCGRRATALGTGTGTGTVDRRNRDGHGRSSCPRDAGSGSGSADRRCGRLDASRHRPRRGGEHPVHR